MHPGPPAARAAPAGASARPGAGPENASGPKRGIFPRVQVEGSYVCWSCGETVVVPVDPSAGDEQEYVEDCPVCCRPNLLRVVLLPDGDARCSAEPE